MITDYNHNFVLKYKHWMNCNGNGLIFLTFALHKKVILQWIPTHCGVEGNETADFLAKKGSKIVSNQTSTPISFHFIKRTILNKYINRLREEYTTKTSGKEWKDLEDYNITTLQRKSAVATFRLRTGHDCLNKHLHRFGIANSPKYSFCNLNEDMERTHLLHCPAFIEELLLFGFYDTFKHLRSSASLLT